jgi:hypothetical protein
MSNENKLTFAEDLVATYCPSARIQHMGPDKGLGLVATQPIRFKEEYCQIPVEMVAHSWMEYPWSFQFAGASTRTKMIAYIIY